MKFLKIFTDFLNAMEPLSDGSAGRKSGEARRKQNEPTGTKVNQTNQGNDKDKEKDKDKDKESVCRGAAPPVTPASAAAARAHAVPPSWEEAGAIELHRMKEAKRVG